MSSNFHDPVALNGDVSVISTIFEKELLYTERPQTATLISPEERSLTISTSGANGCSGHSGTDGHFNGHDGGHGGNGGHGYHADRNVVGISADGENLTLSRVLPPVPSSIESHPSCHFETYTFPLNNQMRFSLFALGGRGGDGGDGGRGGTGSSGSTGSNASQMSSGTDGGPGGPGGRGGDGGRGGNSGNSANIEIYCKAEDTDLLTTFKTLENYSIRGGRAGNGGKGGRGGSGGSGGMSYSWTESTQVYDSTTQSYKTETTSHTNSGGKSGPDGPDGPDGRDGSEGSDGRAGSVFYIVSHRNSPTPFVSTHNSLYNLRLQSVRFTGIGSGIFEPGQIITLRDFFVDNTGGMESPPHVEIAYDPSPSSASSSSSGSADLFLKFLIPSFRTNITIPNNGTIQAISSTHFLQFQILPSSSFALQDNQLLAIDTEFTLKAFLYRTGFIFPFFNSLLLNFPLRIEYPIELSMIAGNRSGLFHSNIPWSISLKNKSFFPFGNHCSSASSSSTIDGCPHNRLLQLKIELVNTDEETSSLITTDNLKFHVLLDDQTYRTCPLTANLPIVLNVSSLAPLQDLVFQGYLTVADGAIPMYSSLHLQFSVFIGDLDDPLNPEKMISVQREFYSVQMAEARKPQLSSSPSSSTEDVILVINSDNTREEILYWMEIIQSLGMTVNVWNVSLYHGISYSQKNYSLLEHCIDSLVIFLNTPFIVPHSSERKHTFAPVNYLEPAEIFEAARRYGLRTYVVHGGAGASQSYESASDLKKALFGWSTPLRPSPLREVPTGVIDEPSAPMIPTAEIISEEEVQKEAKSDKVTVVSDGDTVVYAHTAQPTTISDRGMAVTSRSSISAKGSIIQIGKNDKGEEMFDGRNDFLKSLLNRDRLRYQRDERLLPNHATAYQYILLKYYHVFTVPKEQKFHHRADEFLEMLIDYRPDRAYFIKKNYTGPKKTSGMIFKRYDCGDIEVRRGLDHTYAMVACRGLSKHLKLENSELDAITQQRQIDMFVVLKLFPLKKKFAMLTQLINRPPSAAPLTPVAAVQASSALGTATADAPSQRKIDPSFARDQMLEQQLLETIVSDVMDELRVYFDHINKVRYPWKTYNSKLVAKDIFTSLTALSSFALIQIPNLTQRRFQGEDLTMQKKVEVVQRILVSVGVMNRLYYKANYVGNSLTPQLSSYLVELFVLFCHSESSNTSSNAKKDEAISETKEAQKAFNLLIDEECNRLQRVLGGSTPGKLTIDNVLAIYQDPYHLQTRANERHVFLNHWVAYDKQRSVQEFIIAHNERRNDVSISSQLKSSLDDHFAEGKVLTERIRGNAENLRYHPKTELTNVGYLAHSDRNVVVKGQSKHVTWEVL